jgi:hypothetical protein
MRNTTGLSLALAAATLLAACATEAPNLSAISAERYDVPATKILISNYIPEEKYSATAPVYANGFFPLPNNSTVPSFPELVLDSLSTRLSGNGSDPRPLEIAVLNAQLMMESTVADSVLLINIGQAFSERKYKCRVDANIRFGDSSVRRTFEAIDSRNRAWSDLPTPAKAAIVEKCLEKIGRDVAVLASELSRKGVFDQGVTSPPAFARRK